MVYESTSSLSEPMAAASSCELVRYQEGVDLRRDGKLYGMSGKTFHRARWMSKRADPIILVDMDQSIAQHEAYFYRQLNGHQHIVHTFGYMENDLNRTIFVQDFAQRGDLGNLLIDNCKDLSQTILVEMFAQIANGMSYMASKSMVHADLGCRNILVYRIDTATLRNTQVKITDFGLSRALDNPTCVNRDASILPIRYCAPEILRYNHLPSYTEQSDVYSMGVLMWEALSNGEMPYSSVASDQTVREMKMNDDRLSRPSVCDNQLWILMTKCWPMRPDRRINFKQMEDYLSRITITEATNSRLQVFSHQLSVSYEFQLDVDIQMDELYHGSYRNVYPVQWMSRQAPPIVLIRMDEHPSEYEMLFYTKFRSHPQIVHTFGFVKNDFQSIMLLQERASHGNLQDLLVKHRFRPDLPVSINIFSQIIEAMIYLTAQHVVHGDLRCENILVFQMNTSRPEENIVKLTNFTSAQKNDPEFICERRLTVPVRYCALEILRSAGRSNYSEWSDVYAMGVLMWQVCSSGEVPYSSSTTNGEVRQRKLKDEKLLRPASCHDRIWPIIRDCWHNEPSLRYQFSDIKIRLGQVIPRIDTTCQYQMDVHVQLGKKLGKIVHAAKWISEKKPPIVLLVMDPESARQELPFYLQLSSHTNIVQSLGLVQYDPRFTVLLQERALHGDLLAVLQTGQFQPSESVLVAVFAQIAQAMSYLVQQDIVHGDLRCENILVFQMHSSKPEENQVKLTKFNRAHRVGSPMMHDRPLKPLVRYCAPELLEDTNPANSSELSDVYSMGVLIWQACSKGSLPYGSDVADDVVLRRRLNDERLPQPDSCNGRTWSIVGDCSYQEPTLRYRFSEILTRLSKASATTHQTVVSSQQDTAARAPDQDSSERPSKLSQRLQTFLFNDRRKVKKDPD